MGQRIVNEYFAITIITNPRLFGLYPQDFETFLYDGINTTQIYPYFQENIITVTDYTSTIYCTSPATKGDRFIEVNDVSELKIQDIIVLGEDQIPECGSSSSCNTGMSDKNVYRIRKIKDNYVYLELPLLQDISINTPIHRSRRTGIYRGEVVIDKIGEYTITTRIYHPYMVQESAVHIEITNPPQLYAGGLF